MIPLAMPAGYSGTPLAKKLGITPGCRLLVSGAPEDYLDLLAPLPEAVAFKTRPGAAIGLAHLFVTDRVELAARLGSWRESLPPATPVWVSWPKKASKVPTTVTEDVIREIALPMGYVDVKVCAVSDVWSGLKLVVRKTLR